MNSLRVTLAFVLVLFGCGGGGGGQGSPETWSGTLTGDNSTRAFCAGSFSESAAFTLTVPSSLAAAVRQPYNADAEIRSGTGHFTGDEGIGTQCPNIYMLVASHVDSDVVVDIASVVNESSGPTPEINVRAVTGSLFPFHLRSDADGHDVTVDDEYLDLRPTQVSETSITGTWVGGGGGSGSGNQARGTFVLTRK